ncbi:MAG: 50S ribosomal protein L3 [Candidatus Cloacimonetes bacterium]|nr:50S ribosomal protein L3 [Candidatus Cloacimonadota bacterium]MBL7085602.1 50S ribosomal protein L3 [Candidatus Cloacimonadota bacterium]
MLGLIGKKIGMTRAFYESGDSIPVTLIQAGPCTVTQLKSIDTDGYITIQLGFNEVKDNKLNKPLLGHFKKNKLNSFKFLKEFKVENKVLKKYKSGSVLNTSIFKVNEIVKVTGTSKGKGFAGVMKRHKFHGKNMTHGTHESFRGGGSIGQCATPSRVFRGKKMSGHMGNQTVTVKNLTIFKIDKERNLIFIKGAIPGHRNSIVTIRKIK